MRLRLLAFVPPATAITVALLISASTLVSALEASLTPVVIPTIPIERFESQCEILDRRIAALSRSATSCNEDLHCLGSPILCPVAMDAKDERDYQALLEQHREHCGVPYSPFDRIATSSSEAALRSFESSLETLDGNANACRSTVDWLRSAEKAGPREPSTFIF